MSILIGADLVPTETNVDLFAGAEVRTLLGEELQALLAAADYRIFNLETPLTDVQAPIDKCGPNLIAPAATVAGYKAMGVDLLTLANNHIMDQGVQGLDATCVLLKANGIAFLGVGSTPQEAAEPYLLEFGGKKVGIYACAEYEFSIVTENSSGANPFDPLYSLDHVAELKAKCDYVIVLYHGGKEHYRYPSPRLQQVCRRLVDKGADLVVCQHSHCVGCEEKYAGGTIVYGQGNFLFDHSESVFWKTGLLVQLDSALNVSYIPIVKAGNLVRMAEGETANRILSDFEERSKQIRKTGFIKKQYTLFAEQNLNQYLVVISGLQGVFFLKVLNKLSRYRFLGWFARKLLQKNFLPIRNYIECEAHRELLIAALKEEIDG